MNKEILVMTSSGPVPYREVEKKLPDGVREFVSELMSHLVTSDKSPEMTISYYEKKLADKYGVSYGNMRDFLSILYSMSPVSVFNLLLRTIAVEMDMNYPGNIRSAKEIWVVSTVNGSIVKFLGSKDYKYECFAAFRCKDDVETALEILKPLYNNIYGGKQEDKGCNED